MALWWISFFYFFTGFAFLDAKRCQDEEGFQIVSICTSRTVTGAFTAISTEGVSDTATGTCSCSITVFTFNNDPVPVLYYDGPGYPGCRIEFIIGGYIFSCFNGFLNLPMTNYDIVFKKTTLNSSPGACMRFRTDGSSTEIRITCQQPDTPTATPPPISSLGTSRTTSVAPTKTIGSGSPSHTHIALTTPFSSQTTAGELVNGSTTIRDEVSKETTGITTLRGVTQTSLGTRKIFEQPSVATTIITSSRSTNNSKPSPSVPPTTTVDSTESTFAATSNKPSSKYPISPTSSSPREHFSFTTKDMKERSSTLYLSKSTAMVGTSNSSSTSNTDSPNTGYSMESKPTVTSAREQDTTTSTAESFPSTLTSTQKQQFPSGVTSMKSTEKKDDDSFVLAISLTCGLMAFLIIAISSIVLINRRRKRSSKTTLQATDQPTTTYIDAFESEETIMIDESVYFTGTPVVLETSNNQPIIDDYLHTNPSVEDLTLHDTLQEQTDIYTVVTKHDVPSIRLPRPRLISFKGEEEPEVQRTVQDISVVTQQTEQFAMQQRSTFNSFRNNDEPVFDHIYKDDFTKTPSPPGPILMQPLRKTVSFNDNSEYAGKAESPTHVRKPLSQFGILKKRESLRLMRSLSQGHGETRLDRGLRRTYSQQNVFVHRF